MWAQQYVNCGFLESNSIIIFFLCRGAKVLTVAELEAEHFLEEEEKAEMRWQMAIAKASNVHAQMNGRRFSPIPAPLPRTTKKVPSIRRKTTADVRTASTDGIRRLSFEEKRKLWMKVQKKFKRCA